MNRPTTAGYYLSAQKTCLPCKGECGLCNPRNPAQCELGPLVLPVPPLVFARHAAINVAAAAVHATLACFPFFCGCSGTDCYLGYGLVMATKKCVKVRLHLGQRDCRKHASIGGRVGGQASERPHCLHARPVLGRLPGCHG